MVRDKMPDIPGKEDSGVNYWALIGIIIAVSPAIGYLIAFLYEQAYFGYFGIPSDLIIVDWAHLLLGMASVLSFSYILFIIFIFPSILRYAGIKIRGIIADRLVWLGSMMIFVTLLSLNYYASAPLIWMSYLLPLVFSLQYFIFPLISQTKIRGYKAKLHEQGKIDANKFDKNNPEWVKKYGLLISYSFGVLMIVTITAVLQGRLDAGTRKEFLVFTNSPNTVVLNSTQNQLICVELNPDNVSYNKVFTIRPVLTDSGTSLQIRSVGPLKPK